MGDEFKVRVGQFEGPLEMLLDMVERRKLHISDISLSQVADEFIEHVKSFEEFPMADSTLNPSSIDGSSDQKHKYVSDIADFILVASTLLLIKSKSLLPNLELTEEEQVSIEDLEKRLERYKKFKELSKKLGGMFGDFMYFARERRGAMAVFSPTAEITLSSMESALRDTLNNVPKKAESAPQVKVAKVISLEEMIDRLSERIEKSLRTSFKEFAGLGKAEKVEKVNIIVSFLAMLELVKQGSVRVSQNDHFADIEIESEATSVPAYY